MPLPSKLRQRKPARSQDIESLLKRKDKWNKDVSELIHELIALKRLFNGAGDAEYGLKPRRIVDHFDGGESSFLNEVSQLFNQISGEGREIVQMQNENSQKRKQRILEREKAKSQKAPESAPAPTPEPIVAASKLELVSQGTNPLTRALMSVKVPFKGKNARNLKDIHSFLLEMKDEVEEMQDAVVSKNAHGRLDKAFTEFKSAFAKANAMYNKYLHDSGQTDSDASLHDSDIKSRFEFYKKEFLMADSIDGTSHKWKMRFIALARLFNEVTSEYDKIDIVKKTEGLYQELLDYYRENYKLTTPGEWKTISEFIEHSPVFSSTQESTETNKQRKRELLQALQPYAQEFHIAGSIAGTPSSFKTRFLSLMKAYETATDAELQDRLVKVSILYKELLSFYRANYKFSGPWESVAELYHKNPQFITPEDYAEGLMADDPMVSLAHNVLSRLLKKKLLQLSISNDSHKGVKLELYETLSNTRELLFQTMDMIEANLDSPVKLGESFKSLKVFNDEIRRNISLISPEKSK